MAKAVDVDTLTDQLYASAPDDFVRVRKEGAGQLKAAGHAEVAAEFAKLPKPSVSAWLVNLLARGHARAIEDVIGHGDALRKAHVGGAGAAGIRAAQAARNAAIDRVVGIAEQAIGRTLSESHRAEVAATLEAASAGAEAAGEVRAGRLVRPLEAPTGFEAMGGLTVMRGGRTAPKPSPRRDRPSRDAAAADDGKERLALLQADAEATAKLAETARAAAGALRDRVAELEAQRERLEDELKDVTLALTAVRKEAREADRAAADAERRADRAVARLDRREL